MTSLIRSARLALLDYVDTSLPADPESVELPAADAEWLAVQFAMLENW